MFRIPSFSTAEFSVSSSMQEWRARVLDGMLGGIFIIWLFVLASGILNVIETYKLEAEIHENPLILAVSVIAIYAAVTAIMAIVTFSRKLHYNLRAGLFLFLLYFIGVVGLSLASLSGDGRIFLFALIILTAILFDLRASLIVLGGSLLTIVVIGWLQVTGVVVVPAERQINSVDASAWLSGGIIFIILSVAALISVTYLLRALERSLDRTRETLQSEQRLSRVLRTVSNINQLIVRERDTDALLRQACEALIRGQGYSFAWVGLLEPDGLTLKQAAFAGDEVDPAQFTLRLDQEGIGPACAVAALRTRKPYLVTPSSEGNLCRTCPRLLQHPGRRVAAIALPLERDGRNLGVLVVDYSNTGSALDAEEVNLLQELAADLAYALDNIKADVQRHLLADTASTLLTARDAGALWSAVTDTIQQVLRSDRSAIYIYDRANDRLSCPHASGLSGEYIAELNRRFHEAPGSRLIADPRPVVVCDVLTDPSVESMRDWMLREGLRSYAVFPLLASHGSYGAFAAYRNAPVPFSDADITAGQTLAHIVSAALENVRLHTETRAKAAELGRLYAAAQEMTASLLDPPALLETLARHMVNALEATSSYIVSINQSEGTMTALAEYWTENAGIAELKSDVGAVFQVSEYPTIMRAMRAGECVVLQSDDPGLSEKEQLQFSDYGIRSMIFIPIMAHRTLLGDVEIWESRRRREFTQAEIRLAQAMATQAASIIENARLFAQTRQRENELAALLDVAQAVSSSLELQDVLKRAAVSMARILNVDFCILSDYDPQARTINTSARYSRDGEVDRASDERIVFPLDDYPTSERAMLDGESIVIRADDPQADPAEVAFLRRSGYAVSLMLPLCTHGHPLGLVELCSCDSHRTFAPEEIHLARALADQVAVAIENARLYTTLEQREGYFRALVENAAEGIAILDADGNFRYVAPSEHPLTGYRPEDMHGTSAFQYIHPEDRLRLMQLFQESIQIPGAIVTTEYRQQRKDGVWRHYEVTGHNMLDDPHVAGVVINYRDITERKQAETALRHRADELETLTSVSSALRAAQTQAEMILILIEHAVKVVKGSYGSVFLRDSESGEFISSGWYSVAVEDERRSWDELILRHLPGQGITGQVALTGQIHITDDLHSDPLAVILPGEADRLKDVRSGISLPLRAEQEVIGVLHVWVQAHRSFSETETRLLTAIGEMAGNALQRAALFEQTMHHAGELTAAYDNTLAGWARALELRDELTEGHTRRVTDLTLRLARAMGLPEADLVQIRRGATLHDIGKMGIPDSILLKRGALTDEEQAIMCQHPQFARDMLYPIEFLRPALDIPYCHHEKWDGTGYPRGLAQEEIPLAARIFAVADVWDAITSDRPYRPAWPKEKARQHIRAQAGKYFDPQIVEQFFSLRLD